MPRARGSRGRAWVGQGFDGVAGAAPTLRGFAAGGGSVSRDMALVLLSQNRAQISSAGAALGSEAGKVLEQRDMGHLASGPYQPGVGLPPSLGSGEAFHGPG